MGRGAVRIGLISDTHGLLRPEAVEFLRGCVHVIHGGDIGGPAILAGLTAIAAVTAVRGNNDAEWAGHLNESELIQVQGTAIFVIHDVAQIMSTSSVPPARVVVSGHSHKPSIVERDGVIFINPGSAGPRRFKLPISVGEITVDGANVSARTVELVR